MTGPWNAGGVMRAVAASVMLAAPVAAQTNERTYESFQFRVVTPGARAVAMGKTFIGLADDATAAASNPGGLSNLLDPEISLEFSAADFRLERMVGVLPFATERSHGSANYLSFASFVTPVGERGTVTAFYNSRQRYREEFRIPNFRNDGVQIPQGGYYGNIDINGSTIGAGGSVLIGRRLSVGATVVVDRLQLRVESNTSDAGAPGAVNFRSGSLVDDSDIAVSVQAGLLFKPTARLAIGAVVQPGVTFDTKTRIRGNFTKDPDPVTGRIVTLPIEQLTDDPVKDTHYRIPTRAGGGVSYRFSPSFVALADVGWIRYSERITDRFLIVDFFAQPSAELDRSLYTLDNVVELHAGFEYRLFRAGRVFALRAGAFSDPDHQMRFDFDRSNQGTQARAQMIQFNTVQPCTTFGFTGGGGLVLGNRLQIDAAYSWSQYERTFVVSSVVRFPK